MKSRLQDDEKNAAEENSMMIKTAKPRDANISRLQLVVKLDYKNLSLDCKLIKYKLAFVVCLWPWSVFTHYKLG